MGSFLTSPLTPPNINYADSSTYAQFNRLTYNKRQLCDIIRETYNSEPGNAPKVAKILKSVWRACSLDMATYGTDVLYDTLEYNGQLDHPEVICLHHLVYQLDQHLRNSARAAHCRSTRFRIRGLVQATGVHIDPIYETWAAVLRSGGDPKDASEAAHRIPEAIDIPRLVRDGYSKKVSDASKMASFIESLQPNARLVMRGFEELIVEMKEERQVDTYEFMDVVQRFKEATAHADTHREFEREFKSATAEIPPKIRNLFFPSGDYCVMYSRMLKKFVSNEQVGGVTILSKKLHQNSRLQLKSVLSSVYGAVFKIIDAGGFGLKPGYRWSVETRQFFRWPAGIDTSEYLYKIKPFKNGEFFTVVNVANQSLLVAAKDLLWKGYVGGCEISTWEENTQQEEAFWQILDFNIAIKQHFNQLSK